MLLTILFVKSAQFILYIHLLGRMQMNISQKGGVKE